MRAVCLDDPAENRAIDRVQQAVLRAALRQIAPAVSANALDYGCGAGRWLPLLRAAGYRYHGVDIADEMLALARARAGDAEWRALEVERVPYPDRSFELVWCVAVVHHNPYDRQEAIIAELARLLTDCGTLVLFEGVSPRATAAEVYYPRPLSEWTALAAHHGLTPRWHRGASYFLLRTLVTRALRIAPSPLVTKLDAALAPWLLPLLPRRYHTRAAMVFHKPSTGDREMPPSAR